MLAQIGRYGTSLMQVLSLIAPFLFTILVINKSGVQAALDVEVILSMLSFFAIIVDWSSSTFLARIQGRLLASGGYASVILAKLLCSFALFLIVFCLDLILYGSIRSGVLLSVFLIGLALSFDPSWIYFGKLKLWVPKSISAFRYSLASIIYFLGQSPATALAIAFLLTSLFYTAFIIKDLRLPSRLTTKVITHHVVKFRLATASDILTAGFTRLDTVAAVALLPAEQALIYVVCRKLVLGIQSVAFASAPLLYLERDPDKLHRADQMLMQNSLIAYVVGAAVGYYAGITFFDLPPSMAVLSTLLVFLLILPLSLLKIRMQYRYLFKSGKVTAHFYLTSLSIAVYALGIAGMFFLGVEAVIYLAILRVLVECVYFSAGEIVRRSDKA